MKIESDECYRPCGAAKRLGVSQTHVGRLIHSGRITAAQTADGGYLIPVDSLDRYDSERKSVKNGTKSDTRAQGIASTSKTAGASVDGLSRLVQRSH